MKRLWIILFVLLIVGCSKEPINYEETLNERDGVFYTKDTNKPYSGQVFSLYEDGKKYDEGTLKDGRMISRTEWSWYDNGQKLSEITYKNREKDGLETNWYENGQKNEEGTWKDGKEDGLWTNWYYNGQKWWEITYKDGKEGGIRTTWYENGQKRWEGTYKDGNIVSYKRWNEDGSLIE